MRDIRSNCSFTYKPSREHVVTADVQGKFNAHTLNGPKTN